MPSFGPASTLSAAAPPSFLHGAIKSFTHGRVSKHAVHTKSFVAVGTQAEYPASVPNDVPKALSHALDFAPTVPHHSIPGPLPPTKPDLSVPVTDNAPINKHESNAAYTQAESPAVEYAGKLRWQTPPRAGIWLERWESARQLGMHVGVRSARARDVGDVLRSVLADAVVTYVGPHLPRGTVEKWLCLLCEYLELNADEQVLVICLLRLYARCGGRFVGQGDWARPQRWECVIAVACYLAVLLTEEFPGRTAIDLKELLGPNFRFGAEQVAFLKTVDWRICIAADDMEDVKSACYRVIDGDPSARDEMRTWFAPHARDVSDAKRWCPAQANPAIRASTCTPSSTSTAPTLKQKTEVVHSNSSARDPSTCTVGKKRSSAAVTRAEDCVVPPYVVRRIDPAATAYANAYGPQMHVVAGVDRLSASYLPPVTVPHALGGYSSVRVAPSDSVPTLGGVAAVPYWGPRW